jgi:hypothetical protein
VDGLTHYTSTLQGVVGILNDGFAWVPNRRNLMSTLVGGLDFSKREPQQFGMISFTDWSPPAPPRHREAFGDLGIVVSRDWALAAKPLRGFHPDNVGPDLLRAQRVIYVEEGPFLDALRFLYTTALNHLSLDGSADSFAWLSATSSVMNKAMAGVEGQALWANLLTLYEYLEKGEHAFQSEWRIVHPLPFFGYAASTPEIIATVSRATGWAQVTGLRALQPPDEAITGFVCPRQKETALRQALPPQFSERQIVLI